MAGPARSALTARTALLGVVGFPVAHSLSPAMQAAGIAALGLDWAYGAFAVPPALLPDALRGAAALGFRGLNVTIPHKEAALALCEPDELARRAGAVNTLCFDEGRVTGHNSDVPGFAALCAEAGCALRPGLRAVVLGAGGAARAAILALRDAGVDVAVFSRTPRALRIGEEEIAVQRAPLRAALAPVLAGCDLFVDSTPVGLGADPARPELAYPELDLSLLPRHAVVVDLVVRPRTALTVLAERAGLRASAGAPMLLHQGALALERWAARPLPEAAVAAMRAALDRALGGALG